MKASSVAHAPVHTICTGRWDHPAASDPHQTLQRMHVSQGSVLLDLAGIGPTDEVDDGEVGPPEPGAGVVGIHTG